MPPNDYLDPKNNQLTTDIELAKVFAESTETLLMLTTARTMPLTSSLTSHHMRINDNLLKRKLRICLNLTQAVVPLSFFRDAQSMIEVFIRNIGRFQPTN